MVAQVKGRRGSLNIFAGESVHPAFDMAGETMDIPVKRISLRDDIRADPDAMAGALDQANEAAIRARPPRADAGLLNYGRKA